MKVFIAHSSRDQRIVERMTTFLREGGNEVAEPNTSIGGNVLAEISSAIRSADVLVAVVTGANANVFYELGLAAGANVPTLIAAPAGEPLPMDLRSVPYVELTGDILRDVQTVARRVDLMRETSLPRPIEFDSAEAALRDAIRDPQVLEAMSPSKFEHLVRQYFVERGFPILPRDALPDTGADFVFRSKNRKDLVIVQVKKLSRMSRVSVEAVRALLSAVSAAGASRGILISTSDYTAAAQSLSSASHVTLRTLEQLLELDVASDQVEAETRRVRLIMTLKRYFGHDLDRHKAWIVEFVNNETQDLSDERFSAFIERVTDVFQAPTGARREAPKEQLIEELRKLKRESASGSLF